MAEKNQSVTEDTRWHQIRAKASEERVKSAFRLFRANGIEPILIKGWAAAREYPESFRRFFGDIDLCVAPEIFEKALPVAKSEEGRRINIDLHCGLRHLDTFEWEDLFENSRMVPVDEVEIRILRAEDHLRVLCVHWLTDGGAYKERLLDIFYLLEKNREQMDWERSLGKLSPTRRGWILQTIAVVHRYFGLSIADMPFSQELKNTPRWMIETLEKEWASEIRLKPLHTLLWKRREFWQQLKKRFPPNAIQATIETEGRFDESTRIFNQLGSILLRLKPSAQRILEALRVGLRAGSIEE